MLKVLRLILLCMCLVFAFLPAAAQNARWPVEARCVGEATPNKSGFFKLYKAVPNCSLKVRSQSLHRYRLGVWLCTPSFHPYLLHHNRDTIVLEGASWFPNFWLRHLKFPSCLLFLLVHRFLPSYQLALSLRRPHFVFVAD
jgi:hypothetical protein